MSPWAASGLAWGDMPGTSLVETAISQAQEKLEGAPATTVVLYLTPDFAREAPQAIKAAARKASCLQVSGGLVAHPFTEQDTVLDRSAAAVLLLSAPEGSEAPRLPSSPQAHPLTLTQPHPAAPQFWYDSRHGLECAGGPLWSQGRLQEALQVDITLGQHPCLTSVSLGLQPLSLPLQATTDQGFRLLTVSNLPALDSLRRVLPPELRERQPLHTLFVLPQLPDGQSEPHRPIAILEAHGDGSLTLSEALPPNTPFTWAMRLPVAAEMDMNRQMESLSRQMPKPCFGLMHACLSRGPWFHGGEDANRAAWRHHFGDLPLLGAYGNGQICPRPHQGGAHLIHNSVVTLLYGDPETQES